MSLKILLDPDAFWQFACELYMKEGVKTQCLHAQNQLGLNVNLLLFCAWLARFNKTLSASHWQDLKQGITSSDIELAQVRQKRNGYKKGTQVYKDCLEQELQLEAQQQALILRISEKNALPDAREHPLVDYFQLMDCTETNTRDKLILLFSINRSHDYKDVSH